MGVTAIGVDPALGGGYARVCADLGEKLTILDAATTYDLSRTEEQLDLLELMVSAYRPSLVVIEFDAQQKGLGNDDRMRAMAHRYGFTIKPHYTRGQKLDEIFGVASMDQSFKNGDIRIPYGGQATQDRMSPLIAQLRAWRPDIKTKNLTQDLVMALWFIWRQWQKITKVHTTEWAATPRPSWAQSDGPWRGLKVFA